ncbi:hypothetical protein AEGHOMDF_5685 [Methylobacterium soli]|nr:hypothetical protein AEGHOMDF_5685 [Methylobacterium soli]
MAESSIRSRASLSRIRSRQRPSMRMCSRACAATWPIAVMAKTGMAICAGQPRRGASAIQAPLSATATAPAIASSEAARVARREPEITASSGIAASQIAAAELAPPVRPERQTIRPVSPAEDRACASQSEPVRDRSTAAKTGRNRLATASASITEGTPRQSRKGGSAAIITPPVARRETRKRSWRKRTPGSSMTDSWTNPARRASMSEVRAVWIRNTDTRNA